MSRWGQSVSQPVSQTVNTYVCMYVMLLPYKYIHTYICTLNRYMTYLYIQLHHVAKELVWPNIRDHMGAVAARQAEFMRRCQDTLPPFEGVS